MKVTKWIAVWAMAMIGLTAMVFAQTTTAPMSAYRIEETRLGLMDAEILSPVYSRDGLHQAYITHKDGKECVVFDGQAGAEYDGLAGLAFSPDGRHVACAALIGQKWSVVTDGQEGAKYDGIEGTTVFSPDSNRKAYVAVKGQKQFVVADDQAGAEYDKIVWHETVTDVNGKPLEEHVGGAHPRRRDPADFPSMLEPR